MRWLELRVPPPLLGLLVAGLMAWVSDYGPALALPGHLRWGVVLALACTGAVFDLAGLWHFLRARTTVNPLRPQRSSTLVTGGVYRFTRNPMYVGIALVLLAWGIHLRALLPLAGPLLFVLCVTWLQVLPEERVLAQRFGPEYEAYAARVPRWL